MPARFRVEPGSYALVTLHRPSNVDVPDRLASLVAVLAELAASVPVLFPVHPRTRARLEEFGVRVPAGVRLLEPLGYLEFLGLMTDAGVVLTDSGGVQEETTVLGVPCLTLRPATERPVTVERGTNRLVRLEPEAIIAAARAALASPLRDGSAPRPELWDGRAAERIARVVVETLGS